MIETLTSVTRGTPGCAGMGAKAVVLPVGGLSDPGAGSLGAGRSSATTGGCGAGAPAKGSARGSLAAGAGVGSFAAGGALELVLDSRLRSGPPGKAAITTPSATAVTAAPMPIRFSQRGEAPSSSASGSTSSSGGAGATEMETSWLRLAAGWLAAARGAEAGAGRASAGAGFAAAGRPEAAGLAGAIELAGVVEPDGVGGGAAAAAGGTTLAGAVDGVGGRLSEGLRRCCSMIAIAAPRSRRSA